jgi:hypothetical protein
VEDLSTGFPTGRRTRPVYFTTYSLGITRPADALRWASSAEASPTVHAEIQFVVVILPRLATNALLKDSTLLVRVLFLSGLHVFASEELDSASAARKKYSNLWCITSNWRSQCRVNQKIVKTYFYLFAIIR